MTNDYTVRYRARSFRSIARISGWECAERVRVEERLDGTIAVRFQGHYVRVRRCAERPRIHRRKWLRHTPRQPNHQRRSDWMKNFSIRSAPSLRQAVKVPSNAAAEHGATNEKERRAKSARRSSRFSSPRPQLESSTTLMMAPSQNQKPP